MHRRTFISHSTAALAATGLSRQAMAAEPLERLSVIVQTQEVTAPLPHVWAESAGSDRAAITMRESWRGDLDRWVKEAGLKRVRFHGILNDELGVYSPSIQNRGKPTPNFRNVFEVYDGLVSRGVSPFVEVGFMPKQLAVGHGGVRLLQGQYHAAKVADRLGRFHHDVRSSARRSLRRFGRARLAIRDLERA